MSAIRAFAGGRLFGRRWGDGPPRVLALHGWGRTSADFDRCLEGVDAIALDLPGFGASPAPSSPCGAAGYAGMVQPVLAEFDRPPVVVGHSFGGRVAVHLAVGWPVGRLVLTGVPLLRVARVAPPVGYRLIRWANRIGIVPDRRMESIRRSRGSLDYRNATGVMRDVLVTVVNESYEDQLDRLGCPVDLVWGENDTEARVGVARQALERLTTAGVVASLTVVEGVGHMLPLERPEVLAKIIVGEGE